MKILLATLLDRHPLHFYSALHTLSLNPGKFNNTADILVLVNNDDLHCSRKIVLTSRYCGLIGYSGIADHLP